MSGYLLGLLGGFTSRKGEVEAQNQHESDLAAAREQKITEHLLQSDDPEIQHLALASLLDSANPRSKAKGMAGWLGETTSSPTFQNLQSAVNTPVTTEQTTQTPMTSLPSTQTARGVGLQADIPPGVQGGQPLTLNEIEGGPAGLPQSQITTLPNQSAPAAMPAGSMVTPGGTASTPPPQPGQVTPTPQVTMQPPPQPYTLTERKLVSGPRKIFLSPVEKYSQEQVAKNRADIEGDVAAYEALGMPHDAALKQVMTERLGKRSGAGGIQGQSIAGEAPDETGTYKATFGVFHKPTETYVYPGTTTPIPNFRPRTTTGSTSMGTDREYTSRRFGYGPAASNTPEQAASVEAEILRQKGALLPGKAITLATTMLPNATKEQQFDLAGALIEGTAAPIAAGASRPATTPAQTVPSAAPTGPSGAPPTPGTPPAATSPVTSPATAPPTPATLSGRISANLPAGAGQQTKETGKPLSPTVALVAAKAKATNDLIDSAIAALEPFKTQNTANDSINLAKSYREGVFNPVSSAVVALTDLAGIQSKNQAQLIGGSRAMLPYLERSQHVPKLPSIRQIDAVGAGLSAGATNYLSGILKNDEGVFDTPASMYQKLLNAKENNSHLIKEVEAMSTSPGGVTPTAGAGGGAAGVPTSYKDEKGVYHIVYPKP